MESFGFSSASMRNMSELSSYLQPFIRLSYPVKIYTSSPVSSSSASSSRRHVETMYLKGKADMAYIFACLIGFILLREIFMRYFFSPIARKWVVEAGGGGSVLSGEEEKKGVSKRETRMRNKAATRFAEQGWALMYAATYWSYGVWIYCHSPVYPFNLEQMWLVYPEPALPGIRKFYYLSQLAFWFHQMMILHIEQRRKDHWQMFTHHVITIGLIAASYVSNLSLVGTVVLVFMDFCDILLPLAKMLKYLGLTTLTDATFGLFLVGWLCTRQIALFFLLLSGYTDCPRIIDFTYDPSKGLLLSKTAWICFMGALTFLYFIMCSWFMSICKVAYKVVSGEAADDIRSDDEDDGLGDNDDDDDEGASGRNRDEGISLPSDTVRNLYDGSHQHRAHLKPSSDGVRKRK